MVPVCVSAWSPVTVCHTVVSGLVLLERVVGVILAEATGAGELFHIYWATIPVTVL